MLPTLSADLVLMHAPAVFDFRSRRDIYFPFLGTSGDVPITPLYEYFPIGFKALQHHLGAAGFKVIIINLSTLLIRYPRLELDQVIAALDAPLIGIDLHWMVHVQGSLAVANEIRRRRSDVKVIFGGISSTYFADQLIRYPQIDMVMRGYETLEPMRLLLERVKRETAPVDVPNLLWKDANGSVVDNAMAYMPDVYGCEVDWTTHPVPPPSRKGVPIRELLSTQNAGCAYNCGWCGGSREAFRRIYKRQRALARKAPDQVSRELASMRALGAAEGGGYHLYAVGSYNETRDGVQRFLDGVGELNLRSISYEQFHLTSDDVLKRMVMANKNTCITLSPESHDTTIAKLAGRGVYTPAEMEAWLSRALEFGIKSIDIWYFVGMPRQSADSVFETVEYCAELLGKFKGLRVNPMLCPMIPFLDPASTFFEDPEKHGYKTFYRTVEDHRRGMENASIINRVNYETSHLTRTEIVTVGYRAVRALMQAKAEVGFLPGSLIDRYIRNIDDALELIAAVHEADCLEDPEARRSAIDGLGDEIVRRNDAIIFNGVANQAFPINRSIGGRWFDEFGWQFDALDAAVRPGRLLDDS